MVGKKTWRATTFVFWRSSNARILRVKNSSEVTACAQWRECVCVFLSCGPYTWPIIQKTKSSPFAILSSHGPPSPLAYPPFLFLLTTPSNLIPFLSLPSTIPFLVAHSKQFDSFSKSSIHLIPFLVDHSKQFYSFSKSSLVPPLSPINRTLPYTILHQQLLKFSCFFEQSGMIFSLLFIYLLVFIIWTLVRIITITR